MRGFGRSSRPSAVADYAPPKAAADMAGLLDALGVESAHVVGHDWGAAVVWLTAMSQPARVRKLVVLSVGRPRAPWSLRQDEMAWYQLFFQFEGIAEATVAPPRHAHRVAELVPGEPGAPDAGADTRASPGTGPTLGIPAGAPSP
jgi:pimeloyl-ACP methyl ester carboxylesterase